MRASLLFLLSAFGLAMAQTPGTISGFQVKSTGENFIELEWNLVGGDMVINKYTLVYDGDFSTDIRCPVEYCTHNVPYLDPCTKYDFVLTPIFDGGLVGEPATTSASTLGQTPGAPLNPAAVSNSNGVLVTWERPTESSGCIDHYSVCTRVTGEIDATCTEAKDNTIVLSGLLLCTEYTITIAAVTPAGASGPEATVAATTPNGVPGIPQNVEVTLVTEDMIRITYDDPLENPNCVDEYGVIYGEVTELKRHIAPVLTGEHEHTISPLDPCTNYSIGVYGMSPDGQVGPTSINYAATADTEPMPPPTIIVDPNGPDSIDVSWPGMPDNVCGESITICWNDHIHPEETCQEIGGGGIITGGGGFTITDLLPCTNYEIIIVINSPSGLPSLPVGNFTFTDDVKPNPVENLRVSDKQPHMLTISYDPPSNMEQCVKEYHTKVIDLDETYERSQLTHTPYEEKSTKIDETHNELKACTNYRVEVSTKSRQGLESEFIFVEDVTGEDIPSEARNPQVKTFTDTSVTLLWFQPETNARCATSYRVDWAGGSETVNVSPPLPFAVEHVISGLTPCTPYTFTVTASSATLGDAPSVTVDAQTACTRSRF